MWRKSQLLSAFKSLDHTEKWALGQMTIVRIIAITTYLSMVFKSWGSYKVCENFFVCVFMIWIFNPFLIYRML